MKYALALLLALLAYLCREAYYYQPPVPVRKVVVAKISQLETERQGYPQTRYYAVAADGSACPVGLSTYARLDSGAVLSSLAWR